MTITTVMRTISRPPSSQPSQLEEDVDDGAAEGAVDTGARVAGEDCRVGAVVVPDVDAVAGAGDCAGAGVGDGVGGGSWVGISVGIIASERVGRVIEVRGGRDEDSSGSEDRDGAAVIETVGSLNRPGFGGDSSVESQATRLVRSPSSYRASNSAGGLPPQAP